ncbi:MAG: hypothetical protein ABR543_16905 [Gemmatimonadaceae bacterium]
MPACEGKGAHVRPLVGSVSLQVMGQATVRNRVLSFIPEASGLSQPSNSYLALSVHRNTEGSSGAFLLEVPPARLGRGSEKELIVTAPGLRFVLRHGEIQAGVCGDTPDAALRSALDIAWPLSLSPYGQYRLHCGAVQDTNGSGWLLIGDSCTGKSTSTMALVASGWGYASDDAAYIVQDGESIIAHGWWEHVKLTAASAASLGLSRIGSLADSKCAPILPDDMSSRRLSKLSVNGLLFPEFGARSALEPLRAPDALVRLVRASPWLFCQSELAAQYLACLRAVAMLPAARLILGPELLHAPQKLAELVLNSQRTIA